MDNVTIYTANISNYDNFTKPNIDRCKVNYIREESKTPALRSRYIKCKYWEFTDTEISVWIDSSFHQKKSIKFLIDAFKREDVDIMVMKHPHRSTIRQEAEACKRLKKDSPEIIDKQVQSYKGFVSKHHLPATGFIVRKDSERMRKFMNDWYKEIKTHSYRDQLSFNYALSKNEEIKIMYVNYNYIFAEFFHLNPHI